MIQNVLQKISGIVLAAALVLTGSACTSRPAPAPTASPAVTAIPEETDTAPTVDGAKDALFSLTILDVGQGLSVLVQADGEYLLYDGGGRGASSYVVAYLQQYGVTELEWLVASHYDEDHISGLVGALHTTPVEQALMPDYTTDTQIYQSLQNALAEKAVTVTYPAQGDTFSLGGAEIQIVGPKNCDYDSDNSNSLCLRIEYGDFRCLLTGDAEQDAERDMAASRQDLSCDVYVVGHHGSSSSTSEELLEVASPRYAFLSVGAGNAYGHPTEQTLDALRQHGVALYRTDTQGEVTVYSDGENCWFRTNSCEDWTPGSQTVPDTPFATALSQSARYVLNTHTKKFHYPDCPSVEQMSDKNKDFTDATREELISRGYTPCGRCDP